MSKEGLTNTAIVKVEDIVCLPQHVMDQTIHDLKVRKVVYDKLDICEIFDYYGEVTPWRKARRRVGKAKNGLKIKNVF